MQETLKSPVLFTPNDLLRVQPDLIFDWFIIFIWSQLCMGGHIIQKWYELTIGDREHDRYG